MKLFGSIRELVRVVFRQNSQEIELDSNQSTTYTATRLHQLPPGDSSQILVSEDASQTLTNKSIDADNNTITDIADASIKALAGINATKIADGSVDNTEFQRLGTAGTAGAGNLVTTDGTQTLTGKTVDGDDNTVQDLAITSLKTVLADANKVLRRDAAGVPQSGNNLPNSSDIVTTDASQTLTGKSIDGDDNTVTDLALGTLKTVLADANKVVRRDAAGAVVSDNSIPNSDPIVTTTASQSLSNKTLTSPTVNTATMTGPNTDFVEYNDQVSDPSTPAGAGDVRLYAKDNVLYQIDSNGVVQEVGSGAGGGINYIDNGDAENDTAGWATYADTAQSTPVDGTGGSANVTWTRNTTTPLRGTADFLFTKDAANRQGQGVSYDFSIDSADVSKTLQISTDVKVSSAYVAGDMGVYIYDVTNATLIYPSAINIAQAQQTMQVTFVATTSTSYRLIFHVQTTNASAYTLNFDNVQVGPVVAALGVPFEMFSDFTSRLTVSAGFGSPTTKDVYGYRIGNMLKIWGNFKSGTTTGTTAYVDLPAGMTIDYSVVTTELQRQMVGDYTVQSSADAGHYTDSRSGRMMVDDATTNRVWFSRIGGNFRFETIGTSSIASNNETIAFCFEVPIAEWAGSSVYLSQAQPEYAYNSGTWDAADTTSFAYGPQGQALGGSLSATRTKRVRFLTPIQSTDKIEVQGSYDRISWFPINSCDLNGSPVVPSIDSGGNRASGVSTDRVSGSSTDIDVLFARYQNMANDDSPVGNWPSTNAYWRVVKIPGQVQVATAANIAQSMVRLDTGNGYGSTATRIRRFTNSTTTGTALTYADSATNGMSITVNQRGVYSISYSDTFTGSASTLGISINASSLTTNIGSLSASERAILTANPAATEAGACSATLILNAGDIIRAHTAGAAGAATAVVQFIVTQVAVI